MNRMTPPQAYTREVLAKAYSWLKDQNDDTKAQAQTADALVSLYLQSLRHKREEKTAQFKSELKSMASDLPGAKAPTSPSSTEQLELKVEEKKPEPKFELPQAPVSANRSTSDQSITAYRDVEFPPVPKQFKAEPEAIKPPPKKEAEPEKMTETVVATKSIQSLFPPGSFSKSFEEEPKPEKEQNSEAQDPEIIKLIEEVSERLRIEDTKTVHKMLVSIGYEHLMSVFPKK